MAFDLSTAKPVQSGFDISTAVPVDASVPATAIAVTPQPERKLKLPPPSTGSLIRNSIMKGVAGLGDAIINTPANFESLSKVPYGLALSAIGRRQVAEDLGLTDLTPTVPVFHELGSSPAMPELLRIKQEDNPQTPGQRVLDTAVQAAVGTALTGKPSLQSVGIGGVSGAVGQGTTEVTGSPLAGLFAGLASAGGLSVLANRTAPALTQQQAEAAAKTAAADAVTSKGAGQVRPDIENELTITLKKDGIDYASLLPQAKQALLDYAGKAINTGKDYTKDAATIARQATLQANPIPIQGTRGQLSNDFLQQQGERLLADSIFGGKLRSKFESDQPAIVQNFDKIAESTGGEIQSPYQFGGKLRGTISEKEAASNQNISSLYKQARETAGENPAALNTSALQWLYENGGSNGVSQLSEKASRLGILKKQVNTDGSEMLVPQDTTLNKLYELRKEASKLQTSADGTTQYNAKQFKRILDDIFESAGGSAYRDAAAARRQHALTYESGPKVISNILKTSSETDPATSAEKIFKNTVVASSVDDIGKLYNFLGPDSQQVKNIQAMTTDYLKNAITQSGEADNLRIAALNNAIKNMGGAEKLQAIYGPEKAGQIQNLIESAKILGKTKSFSSAGSNTASKAGLIMGGLTKILEAVPGGNYIAAPVGATRSAFNARNALTDPAQPVNQAAINQAQQQARNNALISNAEEMARLGLIPSMFIKR